jgi:2-polyprenyl-3-methyl-5-hydroxy-6-metoxy-1,4-benzoquinol methylase
MEAVTAGTPIVSTKLGALPEIIPKGCGLLIEGEAHTEKYKKEFIDKVVGILNNPALWEEMHDACKGHDFSWETVSIEWIKEFFPEDVEKYQGKLEDVSANLPTERKTKKKATKKKEHPKTEVEKKERRLKVAEEEDWDKTLVKYREQQGGNLNTPQYWDNQYKYEFDNKIDQRSDARRWNLLIDHIKDTDVVLDYGCGMAEFLSYLNEQKPNVKRYGIDISKFALEKATARDPELQGRLTNNIAGLPSDAKEGYFNVVTCQHVLEHVDEPEEFVDMLRKLVAPNGKLILVVPVNDKDWIEHQRIWYIEDIIELLGRFDCTYKLDHRKKTIRKSDDEPIEEVIAVIQFGGE